MTISVVYNVTPRIQYTATAAQVNFTVPFPFYENSDLLVYQTAAGATASDAADILALNTDYTVTGAGDENGGVVTLLVGATVNDIITIVRAMPEDRLSFYLQGGQFTAVQVNNDFNSDVMFNQQNEMRIAELAPHYQTSAVVGSQDLQLPILGPTQCWVMNSTQTAIVATNFVTGGGTVVTSTSILSSTINQVAHGFAVGNILKCTGVNTYFYAQANSAADAEVVGIVSAVTDANNFVLQYGGLVTGLAGLTAGTVYYLDPVTPGGRTAVRPTTITQVVKPVYVAIGPASAIWTNQLGIVI